MTTRPLPGEQVPTTMLRAGVIDAVHGDGSIDVYLGDTESSVVTNVPCVGMPGDLGDPIPVLVSGSRLLALGAGSGGSSGGSGNPDADVPPGGGAGQVLAKASAADYDTFWTTPSTGGGPPTWPPPGVLSKQAQVNVNGFTPGVPVATSPVMSRVCLLLLAFCPIPARIRVYADEASRAADEARPLDEPPDRNVHLLLDAVTDDDVFEHMYAEIMPGVVAHVGNQNTDTYPTTFTSLRYSGNTYFQLVYLPIEKAV